MFYNVDERNLKVNLSDCVDLKTMVFVDFENYAYGCLNQYKEPPMFNEFYTDLKNRCIINQMLVFADWNEERIKPYASRLKSFGGLQIDCTKSDRNIKDVADFIMLDQIYQSYMRYSYIEQFVLFTGDKHFQSVVAFLKTFDTRNPKMVGIYSLADSYCEELADVADWYIKISPQEHVSVKDDEYPGLSLFNDFEKPYAIELVNCLKHTEGRIQNGDDIVPTFAKTVSYASRFLSASPIKVREVLSKMIDNNLIFQTDMVGRAGKDVRKLSLNWDRLKGNELVV